MRPEINKATINETRAELALRLRSFIFGNEANYATHLKPFLTFCTAQIEYAQELKRKIQDYETTEGLDQFIAGLEQQATVISKISRSSNRYFAQALLIKHGTVLVNLIRGSDNKNPILDLKTIHEKIRFLTNCQLALESLFDTFFELGFQFDEGIRQQAFTTIGNKIDYLKNAEAAAESEAAQAMLAVYDRYELNRDAYSPCERFRTDFEKEALAKIQAYQDSNDFSALLEYYNSCKIEYRILHSTEESSSQEDFQHANLDKLTRSKFLALIAEATTDAQLIEHDQQVTYWWQLSGNTTLQITTHDERAEFLTLCPPELSAKIMAQTEASDSSDDEYYSIAAESDDSSEGDFYSTLDEHEFIQAQTNDVLNSKFAELSSELIKKAELAKAKAEIVHAEQLEYINFLTVRVDALDTIPLHTNGFIIFLQRCSEQDIESLADLLELNEQEKRLLLLDHAYYNSTTGRVSQYVPNLFKSNKPFYSDHESIFAKIETKANALETEVSSLRSRVATLGQSICDLTQAKATLTKIISGMSDAITNTQTRRQIGRIYNPYKVLRERIKELKALIGDSTICEANKHAQVIAKVSELNSHIEQHGKLRLFKSARTVRKIAKNLDTTLGTAPAA